MPIGLAFCWAVFVYLFAGVLVYTLIVVEILCMVGLCSLFCAKAGWFDPAAAVASLDATFLTTIGANFTDASSSIAAVSDASEHQTAYAVLAVFMILLTLVNIVMLIVWRICIKRLISILRECSKVFKDMVYIFAWPLGMCGRARRHLLRGPGLGVYFCYYAYEGTPNQWPLVVAVVLLSLWTLELVRATSYTAMAGAIASWYVHQNAPSAEKRCCPRLGFLLLVSSLWTVLSRHLGSVAFGALVERPSRSCCSWRCTRSTTPPVGSRTVISSSSSPSSV